MSATAAKSYFNSSLLGDYLAKDAQETVGLWGGKLASQLGLEGAVDQAQFNQLVEGVNPQTGDKLTPRLNKDANRRCGFDFNFNAPKGVSMLYAITGDERVMESFQSAYRETLKELEQVVRTRVRRGGVKEERITGNLCWAEFMHTTARPVDGTPDPSLHVHAWIPNATFDPTEGRIKAVDISEIKRQAPYFEAAFHSRFARNLVESGVPARRTDKGWDVEAASDALCRKFSRRTQEIQALADRLGIDNDTDKDQLGAKSRQSKVESLTWAELQTSWRERMTPEELLSLGDAASGRAFSAEAPTTAKQAIDHALAHGFEQHSVVEDKRLLADALKFGVGHVSPEEAEAELNRADVLIREVGGRRMVTTQTVLDEERAMLDHASGGRGNAAPMAPAARVDLDFLNEQQIAAIQHAWNTRDQVLIIAGGAGVGKTTVLSEISRGLQETGRSAHAFAPTIKAARGGLRDAGFNEAETVAKLLADPNQQERIAKGDLIVVDEAGMLGSRDMHRLFEVAKERHARVLLVGDEHQHASVSRGDALRLLRTEAGLQPAELRITLRQQDPLYRQAVDLIAAGELGKAFERLDEMNAIKELDDSERYSQMAKDHAQAIKSGDTTLVVSPTHAEAAKATDAIRSELRSQGMLGNEEQAFIRLKSTQWTEAQRRDASLYQPNHVVEFHGFIRNIGRGPSRPRSIKKQERFTVTASTRDAVTIEDSRGHKLQLPMKHAEKFTVYRPEQIALSSGDRIRLTGTVKTQEGKTLRNGHDTRIKSITKKGDIRLAGGGTLSSTAGHFDHGFTRTSYSAQGSTVDRVYVVQSEMSSGAADLKQAYVSISRGKRSATWYTDDKELLRESVSQSRQRQSATELMHELAEPSRMDRLKETANRARQWATRKVDRAKEIWHDQQKQYEQHREQRRGLEPG